MVESSDLRKNPAIIAALIAALGTITAAIITVFGPHFLPQITSDSVNDVVGNKVVSTVVEQSISQPSESTSLTISEIISTLENEKLSQLQKQSFVESNQAKRVTWRVSVTEVRTQWGDSPESDLLVVFKDLSQVEQAFAELTVAIFDYTDRANLMALAKGDRAIIEGDLKFSFLVSDWGFHLENSKLVSHLPN